MWYCVLYVCIYIYTRLTWPHMTIMLTRLLSPSRSAKYPVSGTWRAGNDCLRLSYVSCQNQFTIVPSRLSLYFAFSNMVWDIYLLTGMSLSVFECALAGKATQLTCHIDCFTELNILLGGESLMVVTGDCSHRLEQIRNFLKARSQHHYVTTIRTTYRSTKHVNFLLRNTVNSDVIWESTVKI